MKRIILLVVLVGVIGCSNPVSNEPPKQLDSSWSECNDRDSTGN